MDAADPKIMETRYREPRAVMGRSSRSRGLLFLISVHTVHTEKKCVQRREIGTKPAASDLRIFFL